MSLDLKLKSKFSTQRLAVLRALLAQIPINPFETSVDLEYRVKV